MRRAVYRVSSSRSTGTLNWMNRPLSDRLQSAGHAFKNRALVEVKLALQYTYLGGVLISSIWHPKH